MSSKNWLLATSLSLLAFLLPSCGGGSNSSPSPTPNPATLALSTLVSGLNNPLGLEKPSGDSRLFVV